MSGRQPDLADLRKRMDSALEVLRKELQGLRTGRASASLLEPVVVEAYGSEMPLTQVGTIGVPEPRMLTVQVWDRGLVKAVEKAIRNSSLGLNPAVDGQLIRVPLPESSAREPSGFQMTTWARFPLLHTISRTPSVPAESARACSTSSRVPPGSTRR